MYRVRVQFMDSISLSIFFFLYLLDINFNIKICKLSAINGCAEYNSRDNWRRSEEVGEMAGCTGKHTSRPSVQDPIQCFQRWQLSRPRAFHQKCDDRGPTISVGFTADGWVYSGRQVHRFSESHNYGIRVVVVARHDCWSSDKITSQCYCCRCPSKSNVFLFVPFLFRFCDPFVLPYQGCRRPRNLYSYTSEEWTVLSLAAGVWRYHLLKTDLTVLHYFQLSMP